MEALLRLRVWVLATRDIWVDLLRIYLGVGLLIKGVQFISHGTDLMQTMESAHITVAAGLLAHYVIMAHLCGGLMMTLGIVTRLGAAIQVPALFGAVFFVHLKQGLFTQGQTLEFAALVLVLLCLFAVIGAGRLSVDHYVATQRTEPDDEPKARSTPSSHPAAAHG